MIREFLFEGKFENWNTQLQEFVDKELGVNWKDTWEMAHMFFVDLNKKRNIAEIFLTFKIKETT